MDGGFEQTYYEKNSPDGSREIYKHKKGNGQGHAMGVALTVAAFAIGGAGLLGVTLLMPAAAPAAIATAKLVGAKLMASAATKATAAAILA
ncbi:hypothetical protein [Methylobacterium sp. Leaf91]|uniref:hypothetical protein n=1 Tax=Methylobacterium sp. Leaf91 TaxID=1736247 RepID=UPI0006FEF27B|nr:hypothetical protein [Methylobacterium sp. Leaf91]KQP00376.1 hypothetical protein ASF32_00300 [Methylobacterium sp. Leaf91]